MRRARSASKTPGALGFSLIELMVAITIGGILMGGAVSLFITNKETYTVTTDLSRMQESARFALDLIVRDVRMAGFFGCHDDLANITNSVTTPGVDGELWDTASALEGYDEDFVGSWSPSSFPLPTSPDPTILAGTDAITVRYMAPNMPEHEVVTSTTTTVTVNIDPASDDFIAGGAAGVGDCGAADIFAVDSTAADVITVTGSLNRAYQGTDDTDESSAIAAPLQGVRYYVANNSAGIPALHRTTIAVVAGSLTEDTNELFEGVENLQFLYGIDNNADDVPDVYVNAGDTGLVLDTDWRNVVSVRIGLLMRTPVPIGQAASYTVPDLLDVAQGTYNDNFRRRVFITTAAVRNL